MVLPPTAAAVISRGELPSANPSILRLLRSPASTTPSFSRLEARRTASSAVAAGVTGLGAVGGGGVTGVEGRRAATTTTPPPGRAPRVRARGGEKTADF